MDFKEMKEFIKFEIFNSIRELKNFCNRKIRKIKRKIFTPFEKIKNFCKGYGYLDYLQMSNKYRKKDILTQLKSLSKFRKILKYIFEIFEFIFFRKQYLDDFFTLEVEKQLNEMVDRAKNYSPEEIKSLFDDMED